MNPKATAKAKSRLRVARRAIEDLRQCQDFDTFNDIWYTFLAAFKNVYTVLEQGTKNSAQGRQWFGGRKHERRQDPLLQYLYQARNDNEHGINNVAEYVPGEVRGGVRKPGFSNSMRFSVIDGQITQLESLDGLPVLVERTLPHVKLVRVHDRAGRPYDPPDQHRGQNLTDRSPLHVATLAVDYLGDFVAEAERLA